MSESLNPNWYETSLAEVDHLNRFRRADGSHDPFALRGVYENLTPAVKEAAIPHAVSTTYQEYYSGEYWWLDQTPEDVARSGYQFHQHPAALKRVDVEVEEARDIAQNLKPGYIKVFISPRMSRQDAPYEIARQEHLGDDDMLRIHMVDTGDSGQPKGKYMQSLLVRHIPLKAWVDMLRDSNNIFGKVIELEDDQSALSVMKVHQQLELPESMLPEGVVSLVRAVLPYVGNPERANIEQQLELFCTDQASLHTKARRVADRWLSFEVALADSLHDGYATHEIIDFIQNLAFEWNDETAADIMQHTDSFGRIRMTRSLAAKLEVSRQNTLWVSAGVITHNERILRQLTPEVAQQIYINEMFIQTMMSEGVSARDIQQVDSQSSKVIASQNVEAGGGCLGAGKGLFGSSPNSPKTGEGADKKCPEIKNGQTVRCPGCKETVRAIVPSKEKIFCSNANCKLASPHLKATASKQERARPPKPRSVTQRTGEAALAAAK